MTLLFAFLSFWLPPTAPTVMLLDTELRNAITYTERFEAAAYQQRRFPIYANDAVALAAAARRLAKALDQPAGCEISFAANHTTVSYRRRCDGDRSVTVWVTTRLAEDKAVCSFVLVSEEGDRRRVQRKLLDFAAYLLREQPSE